MIIGSGDHQYEVDDHWAKLPGHLHFGTTHAVVEDRQGNIYIHNTGPMSVIVFQPDGRFVSAWGSEYSEGAHGMVVSEEAGVEYLYLSATKLGIVVKTTLDGHEVLRIGTPPRPDIYDAARRFVPTETAIAPNGEIYVADGYGQPWIHRFDRKGTYRESFGGAGSGAGQLNNPHGIFLDTRGAQPILAVADRGNRRIQYFSLDGRSLRMLDHDLRQPCTAWSLDGELYVPDLHSRVSVFDAQDRLILHLGDWPGCWELPGWPNLPRSQWKTGQFSSPHDLHVDRAGNIYLCEWLSEGTGKVTKLVRIRR